MKKFFDFTKPYPFGKKGIYFLYCSPTDTYYLGKHVRNMEYRIEYHLWKLRTRKHWNLELQADYIKYGISEFDKGFLWELPQLNQDGKWWIHDEVLRIIALKEYEYIFEIYKEKKLYNNRELKEKIIYVMSKGLNDSKHLQLKAIRTAIMQTKQIPHLFFENDQRGKFCFDVYNPKTTDTDQINTINKHIKLCDQYKIDYRLINPDTFIIADENTNSIVLPVHLSGFIEKTKPTFQTD